MIRRLTYLFLLLAMCAVQLAFAGEGQTGVVTGKVVSASTGEPVFLADVVLKAGNKSTRTSKDGTYRLKGLRYGTRTVVYFAHGYQQVEFTVEVGEKPVVQDVKLVALQQELDAVTVRSEKENNFGIMHLRSVEGTAIYASKKSELIEVDDVHANKSTNNARQVFNKVAGLNIWESDGAGLQLGIGGRGLSPNRTSHFNTRQNGYDISADALGYPESYYTPPIEAVERIEVVRGAASLQYGTQFGGLLNFKLRRPPIDKKMQLTARQTVGSFGLINSYVSAAGTNGKWDYLGAYQYKQGDGWRENSGFESHYGYGAAHWQATKKLRIGGELTIMRYLTQQPGGLTDALFERDPRQSIRDRNWFRVTWNLAAVTLDYEFSERTRLNLRNFALISSREALGFLGNINRIDREGTNRDLIDGRFMNLGHELRLIHQYELFGKRATFLTGTRVYHGITETKQGDGDAGNEATFGFLQTDTLDSDFEFPSQNLAWFAENLLILSDKWTLTPGMRVEYVDTRSRGYYTQVNRHPLTGAILAQERQDDSNRRTRSFALFGLGISHKPSRFVEIYGNISQNYRAINFNDIRIDNPNLQIDPEIGDERGYNADLGVRGSVNKSFYYDVSAFALRYRDRIGTYLTSIPDPVLIERVIRYRTNISDATNVGVEGVAELEIWHWFAKDSSQSELSIFGNASLIDARYTGSQESAFRDRKVEYVPDVTLKAGVTYSIGGFGASLQAQYIGEQFTDATNAEFSPNAIVGIVPAYTVADFSTSYRWRSLKLEAGVNNLLNEAYFTRRATGYPGPGIIPSDGRSYFLTLQVQI